MTRLASLAVISVVGFVAVNAAYQKSNATYAVDMECANCIRSGNNYCLWIGGTGNGTIQTWNCTQDSTPKAAANGLAENARQLDGTYGGPYYPGGALYPVFEVSFRNVKGSGIISTAFSFVIALAMVLALAF